MLEIDGSLGEGGGQIVRTSLALSLVSGTPVRIENIRAGRKRPGLMRQHLTAAKAAATISRAVTEGLDLGSRGLTFRPGNVQAGKYRFAVGTAGSATLVLQTILPALLLADRPSSLILQGGTHNPMAPPFDFLAHSFLPSLQALGQDVELRLERYGFYPAGGGEIAVNLRPSGEKQKPRKLRLESRGPIHRKLARVLIGNLPEHVAEREAKVLRRLLGWESGEVVVENISSQTPGPGNVILVELESEALTEVVSSFGQRGVRAEKVAKQAVEQVRRYLAAEAPVGEHLADQLLLPMALFGGGAFQTRALSRHTETQIAVMRNFLDVPIEISQLTKETWRVQVGP